METQAAPAELPSSISRYRMLRGKSISSPRVLDIFRDSTDKSDESPLRRMRSSSVHTLKAGPGGDKSLPPEVPALPSYALTPKPVNIPPPSPSPLKGGKGPEIAAQVQGADADMPGKHSTESKPLYEEPPMSPLQQVRSKSKRLLFGGGKKELLETGPPLVPAIVEPMEMEAQRKVAEQKRQDLARLKATLVAPKTPTTLKHKTSLFSLFSRSKKLSTPTSTMVPDTPSSFATTVFSSRGNSLETTSNPDSAKFSDQLCQGIPYTPEQATPVIHGSQIFERRVAVRCQTSTINLPVSSETNAVDILFMASTMMRHHINPASSVIVESYLMLGLERRLRRYERIRDVMNTWDADHENSLLVLSCPASTSSVNDQDLDIDAVPDSAEPPAGVHLPLHLSSRPGKWSKRWITLKDNGQLYSAKTADARPGEDGCVPLCHLTEFDIYSPKEAEVRQSVRPPKRFCYAVKSQQKSAQVADEADFVHFFATDSEETATRFYEGVHRWRSWLLVARKLALDRKMNAPAPRISFEDAAAAAADTAAESKLPRDPSSGASSFRIGSFQPLLDINNLEQLAEEARKQMPVKPPKPVVVEEVRPPQPDGPPPATPVAKAKNQPAAKAQDSSPSSVYNSSPGPARSDRLPTSPLSESSSVGLGSFIFDVPKEPPKPEPKSWFPSATEHTAKLRKDEPPPVFRRPATADAALHTGNPRRANTTGLPPIDTRFLEAPRPFEYFGIPPPKLGGNTLPIYKMPGAPSAPRARPMPRSSTTVLGQGELSPASSRARSRSTVASGRSGRLKTEIPPPMPLPQNRSINSHAPSQVPSMPLPAQPPYPPQRGPAAMQLVSPRPI